MIPTVFIVSLIVFFLIRTIPGTIVDVMVSQFEYASKLDREAIEHALGLDVPVMVQYGRWLGGIVLHGDLGISLWKNTPVVDQLKDRWPVTAELGLMGFLIAQLIALPIGVYSAIRQDSIGDYFSRSFAILCIAIPNFWLATMVIVFPSLWWGYSRPLIYIKFWDNPIGNLSMVIIPAIILGMGMAVWFLKSEKQCLWVKLAHTAEPIRSTRRGLRTPMLGSLSAAKFRHIITMINRFNP